METLNRNHISYQEMDELIGLAEKVSENVETLKGKIKKEQTPLTIYVLYVVGMIVGLMYIGSITNAFLIENPFLKILLGFLLLVALLVPIYFTFQKINNTKIVIDREQKVLQKLLNMIEGYKELYVEDEYGNNNSVLSKALFEMRLGRINFGVK
jgi:ABC-type transport system involved in cytochrome bd biosynthesis fused ATPase/permease subunit